MKNKKLTSIKSCQDLRKKNISFVIEILTKKAKLRN